MSPHIFRCMSTRFNTNQTDYVNPNYCRKALSTIGQRFYGKASYPGSGSHTSEIPATVVQADSESWRTSHCRRAAQWGKTSGTHRPRSASTSPADSGIRQGSTLMMRFPTEPSASADVALPPAVWQNIISERAAFCDRQGPAACKLTALSTPLSVIALIPTLFRAKTNCARRSWKIALMSASSKIGCLHFSQISRTLFGVSRVFLISGI